MNKNTKSSEVGVYNPLSTINDYSDKINLSDLAVKMLQEDLSGLRITSSIDPILYNLAFGEKLFEEAENLWKKLFRSEHASSYSREQLGMNAETFDPDAGGRKMIRLSRVLLAALLSHAKSDTMSSIHKQIFNQRNKLLQIIQNNQTGA